MAGQGESIGWAGLWFHAGCMSGRVVHHPVVGVGAQVQLLACADQHRVARADKAVVPRACRGGCAGCDGDAFAVARVHGICNELQAIRLAEPRVPAEDGGHGVASRLHGEVQRQVIGAEVDGLRCRAPEGPVVVFGKCQREHGRVSFEAVELPGPGEACPVDGMPAEIGGQFVTPAVELESAVADTPCPRHHRVAAPADGGLAALFLPHQPIHSVMADLGDASTGFGRQRDLQSA